MNGIPNRQVPPGSRVSVVVRWRDWQATLTRAVLCTSAVLLSVALVVGCGGVEYRHLSGPTMGTSYRVIARCVPALEATAVATVLDAVNASMSNWDADSEIARFNRAPTDAWVTLSSPLAVVMRAALALSAVSGGAFDVTVGALVDAWGFGPAGDAAVGRPAPDAPRPVAGHGFLELAGDRVRKSAPVRVDLSAIAKGYGVDAVAAALDGRGCSDYLVEIGGEVRVRGGSPAARPWRVAIESPQPGAAPHRVLALTDVAVATSGDYRNAVARDGIRFSHILDPVTGAPVRHPLASATVVHESAMWADGYATLIHVLGPDEGLAFARSRGLAAYLIVRREGGLESSMTPRMAAYFLH